MVCLSLLVSVCAQRPNKPALYKAYSDTACNTLVAAFYVFIDNASTVNGVTVGTSVCVNSTGPASVTNVILTCSISGGANAAGVQAYSDFPCTDNVGYIAATSGTCTSVRGVAGSMKVTCPNAAASSYSASTALTLGLAAASLVLATLLL